MRQLSNLLQESNSFAAFILLVTYLVIAEQVEICNGDEQKYCHANGAQTDQRGGQLLQELDDGTKHQYPLENCMRSAVVEYNRVDIYGDCQRTVEENLNSLEKIAEIASENGAKMLVFPEDGINYASAKAIVVCLEEIPDPETLDGANNVPCDSKSAIYKNTPILRRLSCIARQNDLYLVANYGTRQPCDDKELSNHVASTSGVDMTPCPVENRNFLMLNTNVVFNPKGQFIKRYRKWHPFTESEIFDKAPTLEHVYFDTPYGRFGLFTCFDMIYRDPAVDLVEKYHIDTAIFPTWWFDELPILPAVQYQDGWSATNKVNLLASNILKLSRGSTGSSIFSGNNSLYVSYSDAYGGKKTSRTKLLIANLATGSKKESDVETCGDKFNPKVIEINDNETEDGYRYKNFQLLEDEPIETLDKIQDIKSVCSGEFCCTFDYQLAENTDLEHLRRLVLIVRDGRRPGRFQWYEQVCAVAVLKRPLSDASKAYTKQVIYDSDNGADFLRLSIRARFQSNYVYPSTARDSQNLIDRKQRRLVCQETGDATGKSHDCQLELIPRRGGDSDEPIASKVYAFAMYGRVYERDPNEI